MLPCDDVFFGHLFHLLLKFMISPFNAVGLILVQTAMENLLVICEQNLKQRERKTKLNFLPQLLVDFFSNRTRENKGRQDMFF